MGGRERYPSVTTVLSMVPKPQLEAWRRRVALEGLYKALEAVKDEGGRPTRALTT